MWLVNSPLQVSDAMKGYAVLIGADEVFISKVSHHLVDAFAGRSDHRSQLLLGQTHFNADTVLNLTSRKIKSSTI